MRLPRIEVICNHWVPAFDGDTVRGWGWHRWPGREPMMTITLGRCGFHDLLVSYPVRTSLLLFLREDVSSGHFWGWGLSKDRHGPKKLDMDWVLELLYPNWWHQASRDDVAQSSYHVGVGCYGDGRLQTDWTRCWNSGEENHQSIHSSNCVSRRHSPLPWGWKGHKSAAVMIINLWSLSLSQVI